MNKFKTKFRSIEGVEVLSRDQLKQIMGGDDCGNVTCVFPGDCDPGKECRRGYCVYPGGGGSSSCQDGNNGGCPVDSICLHGPDGTYCI